MNLSTSITEYLEFRYDLAAKTRQIYGDHLHRLLISCGDIDLASITPTMLAKFMGSLRRPDGRNYAPGYLHQIWRTLHTFFNHAVQMQWLTANPMTPVPRPPVPTGQKPRLPTQRIEELIEAIKSTRGGRCNLRNMALILLMVDSGLRRAEAVQVDGQTITATASDGQQAIYAIEQAIPDQLMCVALHRLDNSPLAGVQQFSTLSLEPAEQATELNWIYEWHRDTDGWRDLIANWLINYDVAEMMDVSLWNLKILVEAVTDDTDSDFTPTDLDDPSAGGDPGAE